MKKIKLLMPLMASTIIPATLVPAMTSCSCGNKPVEFATDSWETVIDTCNSGFVSFAKAYCGYKGDKEAEAINKIKQWIHTQDNARYMNISIGKYEAKAIVRVIDVNHDKLSEQNANAKFTFEFADIIDVSLFDIDDTLWYNPDAGSDELKDSILRAYMNGYMLDYIPEIVRNNLKKVDKVTAISYDDEADTYKTVTTSDLMFPLSCNELNAKDVNAGKEGTTYEYYINAEEEYTHSEPLRVKNYVGTYTQFNYWTRSTNFDASPDYNFGVVYDGGIHDGYEFVGGLGVAPAFCI